MGDGALSPSRSGHAARYRFGHGAAQRVRAWMPELDNLVVACRRSIGTGDGALAAKTLAGAWALMRLVGPYPALVELAEAVQAMRCAGGFDHDAHAA